MSRNDHTFTHDLIGDVVHIQRNNEPPIIIPAQPDFGPFQGTGAFTYGSPEVVLPHLDLLDWVAVLPLSRVNGFPEAFPIMVWETGQPPLHGQAAVDSYAAAGYIGQAESVDQYWATTKTMSQVTVPCAFVTNVTALDRLPRIVPICITECYENAQPNLSILGLDYEARKRGATRILPCFGMYHEGDEGTSSYVAALPLSHYLDELDNLPAAMQTLLGDPPSFSFWTAEQLTDTDWNDLREWRQKHAA